jgi:hypothetical protein
MIAGVASQVQHSAAGKVTGKIIANGLLSGGAAQRLELRSLRLNWPLRCWLECKLAVPYCQGACFQRNALCGRHVRDELRKHMVDLGSIRLVDAEGRRDAWQMGGDAVVVETPLL